MGISSPRRVLGGCVTLLFVGASVLWACASADPHPPALGDPPPRKDAGSVQPSDGGADAASSCLGPADGGCNALKACSGEVTVELVSSTAPVAAGGVFLAGSYDLTRYQVFTGSGGKSGGTTRWFRQTMVFTAATSDAGADAGQVFAWDDVSDNSSQPLANKAGSATFDGTGGFTLEITCPALPLFDAQYTASATSLQLFVADPDGVGVLTYTKH